MRKEYSAAEANQTGIYAICNTVSGDCYIGQTLTSFRVRCNAHVSELQRGKHNNLRLLRAWRKYGPGAFVFKVLEIVPADRAMIEAREQHWADHYRQTCKLYNMGAYTASPMLGRPISAEHKRKTAAGQIGRKHTAETRAKMSQSYAERIARGDAPHKGHKHSAATIERLRLAHTGRKASDETRRKMAESHLGHTVTAETRKAISKAMSKRNKGKTYRAKPFPELKNIQTGAIVSGTNLAQFCREHNLNVVCMRRVIQGTQSQHRDWVLNAIP